MKSNTYQELMSLLAQLVMFTWHFQEPMDGDEVQVLVEMFSVELNKLMGNR